MKKILFSCSAFFFGLLPFHAFLKTALDLPPILAAWKEIFLLGFLFAALLEIWENRKSFRIDLLDFFLLFFAFWSLLTGFLWTGDSTGHFFPDNLPQVAFGAKYGFFFFLLFFAFRHLSFSVLQKKYLFRIAFASAGIAIFFGLTQKAILPEEFLTHFGYSAEYGRTELTDGAAISYCHKIENSITHEESCRVQSTFSGPNQFAAFLLIFLPLFFYGVLNSRKALPAAFFLLLFLAGSIDLLFSFSRSAWIGAMLSAAAFFIISAKNPRAAFLHFLLFCGGVLALFFPVFVIDRWDEFKILALSFSGIFLVAMTLSVFFSIQKPLFSPLLGSVFPVVLTGLLAVRAFFDTFFWNIIFRPSSTQGHFERMSEGISAIFFHPFGSGLGDAGPASARFAAPGETGFLPESWYLQVGIESGFLGIFLFCGILFLVGKKLFESKNEFAAPLFLGLVGISGAAMFLHSWEDSAVSLVFWGLAGIALSEEKKRGFFEKFFASWRSLLFFWKK